MKAKLFTERMNILSVADRWDEQYRNYPPTSITGAMAAAKSVQLRTLDLNTATGDDVVAIIGNASWIDAACQVCHARVREYLQLGEEPDYDSATINVCRACVNALPALFGEGK